MKKKYFVSGDIHSFYTLWRNALEENGFDINNPNHIIIVCGDLMDRGEESMEVLNFVCEMLNKNRILLVKGNHEDLFEEILKRGRCGWHDYSNGTVSTLVQLNDYETMPRDLKLHLEGMAGCDFRYQFLGFALEQEIIKNYDKRWDYVREQMKNYYEIGDYIFVHGWIPFKEKDGNKKFRKDWRKASDRKWFEARWVNGISFAKSGIIEPGKTIVCGHWHTSYGYAFDIAKDRMLNGGSFPNMNDLEFGPEANFNIYYDKGLIAIDGCVAHSGQVNIFVFEHEEDTNE